MTPTRSRTIGSAFATLTLWTLMASPALGALTASPNPSATGSYTVSDASPPTLSQNVTTGAVRRFYSCNLVETQPSGTDISYNLGRGPVSRSFTGKSAGTYSYQLQTCTLRMMIIEGELEELTTCTGAGNSLSVTVTSSPPADLMPDFGTASVSAKSCTQNAAISSFTVPAATGGDGTLSYSASGLPTGVTM